MEWKEYTANLLPSFSFFLEKKDETWIAFSKKWTYFGCKKIGIISNQSSLYMEVDERNLDIRAGATGKDRLRIEIDETLSRQISLGRFP